MLPSAGIGGTNSLSLSGDLVAVGAPRAESVYLYRRNLTVNEDGTANGTWGDEPSKIFMSSDFDYDIVHLKTLVHRQVSYQLAFWTTRLKDVGRLAGLIWPRVA